MSVCHVRLECFAKQFDLTQFSITSSKSNKKDKVLDQMNHPEEDWLLRSVTPRILEEISQDGGGRRGCCGGLHVLLGGDVAAGQVPVAAAALHPEADRDGAERAPAQAAEAAREARPALQVQGRWQNERISGQRPCITEACVTWAS